ncbi:DNA-directed RNA polymerase II subunit RPB1 [Cucumispora dikerogammari]|nr:DNA-directed RNA polymerase II subunit RPB1 [Cucumispora dikerogammari]
MTSNQLKSTISSIEFQLLSSTAIKNLAVTQITSPITIENGVPKTNGLLDPRLGSIDRTILCSTCYETKECPGHFGYIELRKRVLNPGYISKIKKILECVCYSCSQLLVSSNSNMSNKGGFQEIWALSKNRSVCTYCSSKQPLVRKEGLTLFALKSDDTNDTKIFLSGDRIHEIFSKIDSTSLTYMGLTQEIIQGMLIKNLLVPPVSMRPSIIIDDLRAEDDLTHKLNDVIKSNFILETQEIEGAPSHVLREYEQLVQFHVSTYMNNEISGIPQSLQKSGRPIKSISSRLKGKEGRVRGNLMGKRVDFSSRSVITAEPNINLDELGVPREIAMIQTFPEHCTLFNIERLQELVNNGPLIYPGANYIIRTDGTRLDLRFTTIELEIGMIVERHLLNGDIVLFNRQPSLHKMSMMSHRITIMEGESFRLNLSATTPYNADFDGDEMNMHVPQSYNSISELELCKVEKNLLSPQSCSPCMYIVQDSLVGVFLLTGDVFLTRSAVFRYLYACGKEHLLDTTTDELSDTLGDIDRHVLNIKIQSKHTPSIIRPIPIYSGKQMFSLLLPNDLQYINQKLNIIDGILIYGRVCKKTVGPSNHSLIHILTLDYSHTICMQLINDVQRLTNKYLIDRGFSVGIGDTIAGKQTMLKVEATINRALKVVNNEVETARSNRLKRLPGLSHRETFENNVLEALNRARDESGKFVRDNLLVNNNFLIMVQSGSKGSFINISQVTACVGQQSVMGKRIPLLFDSKRTLPHFQSYDHSPESRGFVVNSYLSGLECKEFFFHAMGGREGLIDTACKTAETGYMQRRLIKSMEGLIVEWDGSVRDGVLVSGVYGGDGFDSTYLERTQLIRTDATAITDNNRLLDDGFGNNKDLKKQLLEETQFKINTSELLPFDLKRHINHCSRKYPSTMSEVADKKLFFAKKQELLNFLRFSLNDSTFSKCEKAVNCYLLSTLNLSIECLNKIIALIKQKIKRSKITPKEMVGTLASQSIGQPSTQMTLNTFHFAGVTSMEMMGVPRLKEIVNLSGNIKTPSMKIYLKLTDGCNSLHCPVETSKYNVSSDDHNTKSRHNACYLCYNSTVGLPSSKTIPGLVFAKEAQAKMQEVFLNNFFTKIELIYDPLLDSTVIKEDADLVSAYYDLNEDEITKFFSVSYSKFVIRITINREKLVFYDLSIVDLNEIINRDFKQDVYVICSDVNDYSQIIRIRCREVVSYSFIRKLARVVGALRVGGLKNVSKLYLTNSLPVLSASVNNTTNTNNITSESGTWNLQSTGTSLHSVLQSRYVNPSLTTSNDILETESVLGIEAGWYAAYTEFNTVIESGGSSVTSRHVELLCDVMSNDGKLRGITRHGTNKRKSIKLVDGQKYTLNSALKRSSFEQTVDILMEAGASNERSLINSVTDCIMVGKLVPMGTGACEVELDFNMLSSAGETFSGVYNKEIEDMQQNNNLFEDFDIGPGWNPDSPECYTQMSGDIYATNRHTSNYGSPLYSGATSGYSPTSPGYSPDTQKYSPVSPKYSPASPMYSPTSPKYNPGSPMYSPTSPKYNPHSPVYSPTSPVYSPTSPVYSPTSPVYSPTSPKYTPMSPKYTPVSPKYTPLSPKYTPNTNSNSEEAEEVSSSTIRTE